MNLLIQLFNGKTLNTYLETSYNLQSIDDLITYICSKNNIKKTQDMMLIKNGIILKDIKHLKNNDVLSLNHKIKGGFNFGESFVAFFDVIPSIYNAVTRLDIIIFYLGDIFIQILYLLEQLFNPEKMINDILYGVIQGSSFLFDKIAESIDPTNIDKEDKEGAGPFGIKDDGRAVCFPPTMVNLIIMVLCPPLAVFMFKGFNPAGIIATIICILMTLYLYYFPGLIFAAMHVLC